MLVLATSCGGRSGASQRAQLAEGRALFTQSCSGCHTLTGHDTRATGGDLAIADLDVAEILSFIHVMPVHLTTREAQVVAGYVHAARSKG